MRQLAIGITATTSGFEAGMTRIAGSARKTAGSVKASFDQNIGGIAKHSADFDRIGSSLSRVGLAGTVALGLSAKAAIDWQSAWTGVTKTVNGSAAQMAVLETQLRGLAKTLPESHQQIAAVAEAAGQLGIQRESIAAFTKTMVELGDTTNLTSDEAATSLAQFGNIMGTLNGPADKVNDNISRLGATIVSLGNNGASTERDIVQMGLRIAGAGRQVGLSQTQVLAFASSLASVGIEAEAGGTAISNTFLKVDQAVRAGGKGLDLLAKTSGETSAQFRKDFQTNAAGAMDAFIKGLGRVQAEGGDTTKILRGLGITGIRESDALRRLAGAGNLLSDSLRDANVAYKQNSALVNEAAKRYATADAQARIALNQIKDAAITAGQAILPVFAQVATVVGQLAEWFGQLPAPARNAAVAIAATAAVVGLVGGGAIKAVTALAQLKVAFQAAGIASNFASKAFKRATITVPLIGGALFLATTLMEHFAAKSTLAEESASTFAAAMQTVEGAVTRVTAAMNDNVIAATVQDLTQRGAFAAAKTLGVDLGVVTQAALGQKDAMDQVNAVLAEYAGGSKTTSATDVARFNATVKLSDALRGVAASEIDQIQAEKDRREAMEGGTGATDKAAGKAQKHADALHNEAQALQDAIDKAFAYSNAMLQLSGGHIAAEAAMDAAAEAAKKNGKNLKLSTDAGRANQTALDNLVSSSKQYVTSLIEQDKPAAKIVAASERYRKAWVANAVAMGKDADEAEALSKKLFAIPTDIKAQVVVAGTKVSKKEAAELNIEIAKLPKSKRAQIVTIAQTKGAKAAKQAIEEVKDKTVIARSKGDLKGAKQVDAAMKALKDRLVLAKARGDAKEVHALQAAIDSLHGKTVYAKVVQQTITTRQERKSVLKAGGGKIYGPGSETSDSIDARLSKNEWVIKAQSASLYGDSIMAGINAGSIPKEAFAPYGFRDGGKAKIGSSVEGFAVGGKVGSQILKYVELEPDPLHDVKAALRDRAEARRDAERAKSHKERLKAHRELLAATKKLTEAQKSAAETARQAADSLAEPYRSKSHDIDDWLESMKEGAADLKGFRSQISQLRKAGLSEKVIKQLTDQGAVVGSELAQQILAGGKSMVKSLNAADKQLSDAAAKLGLSTIGVKGYAGGGPISGPGTGTSDSFTIRASDGEWMVPAARAAANRSVLEAITYGRQPLDYRFIPGYAHGGPVTQPNVSSYHAGDTILQGVIGDPALWLRKANQRKRDALTMARIQGRP